MTSDAMESVFLLANRSFENVSIVFQSPATCNGLGFDIRPCNSIGPCSATKPVECFDWAGIEEDGAKLAFLLIAVPRNVGDGLCEG